MNWMVRFRGNLEKMDLLQVRGDPRVMAAFLQEKMVVHLQRSCRHEQAAARICWAMADHMADPRNSVLFGGMAMREKRQISRQARQLARLGASPCPDRDTWHERAWRSILIELGPYYSLKWIGFMKRGDLRNLIRLRKLMKASLSDSWNDDT